MDLRCAAAHLDRAYYHQIVDCLMPYLPYAYAARVSGGAVCALSHSARWYRTFGLRVLDDCVASSATLPPLPPIPQTASLLSALIKPSIVGEEEGTVLLIRRHGTRAFTRDSFTHLHRAISNVSRVRIYEGTEAADVTLRAFASARAVVGYHGAGFANALFSPKHTRLVEVSTYVDEANRRPWRSNVGALARWRSFGATHVLRLPVQQILCANGVSYRQKDADHFLKDLPFVSLTEANVRRIVEWVT